MDYKYEIERYKRKVARQEASIRRLLDENKELIGHMEDLKKAAGAQITYFQSLQAVKNVLEPVTRTKIPKAEISRILAEYECGAYDDGEGNYVFASIRKKEAAEPCQKPSS